MQTKTQRCGCSGSGCGCNSARPPDTAAPPCTPCETAAFVRPRFFAGQLLTEDDLGALIDYTVAKQRFHNTRVFGVGVVCGLLVERGPCDSSQVVVEPGYAIDGCGNDLVLACARSLDLAPMIRELQAWQRGGLDCAEPCPPPATQAPPAPHRHYDLYARYTERADQPVAAYPVGDDCNAASCEPTRILEGLAFELRCSPPAAAARTMWEWRAECSEIIDPSEDMTAKAAISRFAEDCRCAAINPRCPASDGDGVLLARIELDRCKVVRICNTVRPYVLAPSTLRYWRAIELPDLAGCGAAASEPPPPGDSGGGKDERRATGEPAPAADPAAMANELAALRSSHARLEQRLGQLEKAARAVPPAAKTKTKRPQ